MNKNLFSVRLIGAVALAVVTLAARANDDREIRYVPLVDREFDSRSDAANVRQAGDEGLLTEGYGKIGEITSVYVTQRCYPGDKGPECKTVSHYEEQEKDLRQQAARHGGDLVVLMRGSGHSSRPISKGDCAYWTTSKTTGTVWNRAKYTYELGTIRQRQCAFYERVEGREGVLTLKGVLWRKEAPLAQQQLTAWRLINAAGKGNMAALNSMLAGGADINASYDGYRAINTAASTGQLAIVKALLAKGASVETEDNAGTPLHAAAANGRDAVVRDLIDRGANVNARKMLGEEITHGTTPIYLAAQHGHLAVTRLLIARGADVNHASDKGLTPLMSAAAGKDATTLTALIAAGANVNAASQPIPVSSGAYQMTALLAAIVANNGEAVAELLGHGARPGFKPSKDVKVADLAGGQPEINQLLKGYEEGVFGYVDRSGKVVAPLRYLSAEKFTEGQAVVGNGTHRGTIGRDGRSAISARFKNLEPFSEGLAVASAGAGWGHVDKTGKWIVAPIFGFGRDFAEGLAPVTGGDKWGYVDKTGALVIKPQFDKAFGFRNGMAVVKSGDSERYIDRSGNFVGGKYDVVGHFSEGLGRIKDGGKWGFVDTSGKVVIDTQYELALPFKEERAVVRLGKNKHGYIDKTGKLVIPARYRDAEPFSEGRAAVRDENGNWGVIDRDGRQVVAPSFDKVEPFSEGLAAVEVRMPAGYPTTKYGFIDKQGKMVIAPTYLKVRSFHEGLAAVKIASEKAPGGIPRGGDWGFIDKTGKLVVQPRYDWTMDFSEGRAWVRSRDKKAWVDRWKQFNRLDVALRSAAARGDAKKTVALLAQGANIESRDVQGLTPLGTAAVLGESAMAKTLLAQGADVNARDRNDYTPLIHAAGRGDIAMARTLIAHGADVHATNNLGLNAVTYALLLGHKDTATAILEEAARQRQR